MTATRYRALQLQRSYAAPQNMCISIRAAARMDVPKLLASRAARCNYSAAAPRRKTCVFPFARQREWMCQNYWHRAQRDATTARLRRALTGDSLKRTRAARSRHRATARCNYHAAEPRSKTCVFPFARQREWMCQNYGHRA